MKAVRRWGPLVIRLGLAAVFVYAGLAKAPWPQRFAVDIESYRLIPRGAAALLAAYLPYLEIIAGLGLLVNRLAAGATLVLSALTAAFIVALVSAWMRGLEIRCGCFGAGEAPTAALYPWWILRDLLLLGGLVIVSRSLGAGKAAGKRAESA